MVTANVDLKSATGLQRVRALCSCLGTTTTTLKMIKAGSMGAEKPIVTINRMAKTVARRSKILDELVDYNFVVRTQSMHYKNKSDIMYTYTVTGFGLSILSDLFGVQFYMLNR